MSAGELVFVAGSVVASLALVVLVGTNLAALFRYRLSLDRTPPSRASLFAWLLSAFAAWTGPLVLPLALVALGLGARERRRALKGEVPWRSELPARMALVNGALLVVATVALVGALFAIWRL